MGEELVEEFDLHGGGVDFVDDDDLVRALKTIDWSQVQDTVSDDPAHPPVMMRIAIMPSATPMPQTRCASYDSVPPTLRSRTFGAGGSQRREIHQICNNLGCFYQYRHFYTCFNSEKFRELL